MQKTGKRLAMKLSLKRFIPMLLLLGLAACQDSGSDDVQAAPGAAEWFANATRSRSADEMKAEMDKVAGQLDTDLKKSTATSLLQMAAIAQEHAARWAIETAPQRKADGIRLAGAIVDKL
jgi:hypothetical protein